MRIAEWLSWALRAAVTGLLAGVLLGCGAAPEPRADGRVYHCVETARPAPPPNTWAKKLPLQRFEYGDYVVTDKPTLSTSGYCNILAVPKTAYLRYEVDGRVVEKRFDLSSLNAQRVEKKTVRFYVDGETVEVQLLTPVRGAMATKETIVRQ